MNNLSVLGQNVFVLYEKLCRVVKGGPSVLIPPLAHVGILQALNDDVGKLRSNWNIEVSYGSVQMTSRKARCRPMCEDMRILSTNETSASVHSAIE